VNAEQILADFKHDVTAFEAGTPRAQQTTIGASQLYDCAAKLMFRLRGEPEEPRLSWQAVVGKAIHEYIAAARDAVRGGLVVEERFVFRGVPATVDYIDRAQRLLIDIKTKDTEQDVLDIAAKGAKPEWVAQVHLGAAAAREAGIQVDWVAILVLPRDGDLAGAQVLGPWEFDETEAIDAAKWAGDVDSLAADTTVDPRDHRGKPYLWCREYCGFFKTCRGDEPEPDLSAELVIPALRYREAQDRRDQAVAEMAAIRPHLLGWSGQTGDVTVASSEGRDRTVT
jgi:hypothetical protein